MSLAETGSPAETHSPAGLAGVIDDAVGLLAPCRRVVVLTGAGCSTGSGIADYRDTDGNWKRPPPIQHQAFLANATARQRYWARSMLGWPVMARARPNPAHQALAAWQDAGRLAGLITQNVDGLHTRAGHREVIDLHGRVADVICLDCGLRSARADLQIELEARNGDWLGVHAPAAPDGDADLDTEVGLTGFEVPACAACGGLLKPDVVFFGDSVPAARVAACRDLVAAADALLIIGSSLMVFSGFRFARQAHARGIPIVAVNRGVTRADPLLSLRIDGDCATVVPALLGRLPRVG